jgi:hypothetical protein
MIRANTLHMCRTDRDVGAGEWQWVKPQGFFDLLPEGAGD